VTAQRSLFLDGLMADNNSDERRPDPRIYYDLPLNSLKPLGSFIFFYLIQDSALSPSKGGDALEEISPALHIRSIINL
jgi:hypothetical protein